MHLGKWEYLIAQRDWGTISVRMGNAKAKALRASRAKREAYERTIARTMRAWEANAERAWMRLREAAGYGGVMQ